ncbi:IS5 family transposase [Kitasatospora phosalacinea]|uniref:IS5 family transposase n=1 Tax=Kitasatospora phosalacinea TaxID=2065 RepID=UPI0036521FAB
MVDDELWALIEPVPPAWPERSPGPRPVDDRLCWQGILFMLFTGTTWQQLPPELGFGSGQACWCRLCRWTEAGVFDQVHRTLLAELDAAGRIDWTRACVDASHVRAKKGGAGVGPSPVDRGKSGSKHHLICDGNGTPLKVIATGGNVPDITQVLVLADGVPALAGRPGRPRERPTSLLGDKGYDSRRVRRELTGRRILPVISRRASPMSAPLGKIRYVVEQTFALLHRFKRLTTHWERRLELHDALASLACALICR